MIGDDAVKRQSRRLETRALLPLYVAVWGGAVCAQIAINSVLMDARFLPVSISLMTLGFAISLALRVFGMTRRVLPLLLGIIAIAVMLLLPRSGLMSLVLPGRGGVIVSIWPALMLSWFMTLYSFCLLDDDLLLFVLIPALAIIGLSATENPNAELLLYFASFVAISIFALSYQSGLRSLRVSQGYGAAGELLHWQLASAGMVLLLVLAMTLIVAVPLKRAGRLDSRHLRLPTTAMSRAFAALGYNSMADYVQLGQGPPALSNREVFQVRSAQSDYWRARTYDLYSGRTWVDTLHFGSSILVPRPLPGGGWEAAPELPPEGTRGAHARVQQQITFTGQWLSPALPAVADPVAFRFASDPGNLTASGSGASFYYPQPYLSPGLRYQVISRTLLAKPAALRNAPPPDPEDPWFTPYLRLPSSAWRVRQLATQITAGKRNDYDRAAAIEEYLRTHYVYNLQVPPAPQREGDIVVYFLQHGHEGYCDMFASAMVVLCRLSGVPARLATGFAEGEYDSRQRCYRVRETDAHAWVEVYFPDYGWVRFDPTPAASEDIYSTLKKGGAPLFLRRLEKQLNFATVLVLICCGFALRLVQLTVYMPWRRQRALLRAAGNGTRGRVLRAYYRMILRLRRRVRRQPSQTATEYLQATAMRYPGAVWLSDMEQLTRLFLAARFGREEVSADAARQAEEFLARIRAGLRKTK